MTMAEYASNVDDVVLMHSTTYTNNWDAYNSWGCVCDPSYTGYDCSIRQCPFGDDPGTDNSVREVQLIDCLCKTVCHAKVIIGVILIPTHVDTTLDVLGIRHPDLWWRQSRFAIAQCHSSAGRGCLRGSGGSR